MQSVFHGVLAVLVLGWMATAHAEVPAKKFPLQNGDIWVMAGDSITAQHLHSNYFEAFCYARYPGLKFAFRNSGVGGHTIPSTLARFDYDIAAWKPTVVSVELGMNDSGSTPTEKFIENMKTWIERVESIHARPILLAPSPVNDGTTMDNLPAGNRNQRLHEYSTELAKVADKAQLPYADQFHALFDLWGHNKPNELVANLMVTARPIAANDTVVGVEHLREFLKAQDAQPLKPVSLQGDPVHPGPCGQLMMAAALLEGLGADGFVSSVSMNADGKSIVAKGCEVTMVTADEKGLSFERLDGCLPFPIPEQAVAVLPIAPTVFALSKYTLQVSGLKEGKYALKINSVTVAELTSLQLAEGVNLTAYGPEMLPESQNPIAVQGTSILKAVAAKEDLVGQWRKLSQAAHAPEADAELVKKLDELTIKVEEADAKIREAAHPTPLKFEIVPLP
ncbi:GDSL-type esterase/lipase family protein [Planctomicrobium sp. SH661]|uniref:GDSL-type esterase/lipase family protein n=1 Tax=Planctomicrobium sp. SH661 TaxID=3448124 RepID=UPI003F5B99B9